MTLILTIAGIVLLLVVLVLLLRPKKPRQESATGQKVGETETASAATDSAPERKSRTWPWILVAIAVVAFSAILYSYAPPKWTRLFSMGWLLSKPGWYQIAAAAILVATIFGIIRIWQAGGTTSKYVAYFVFAVLSIGFILGPEKSMDYVNWIQEVETEKGAGGKTDPRQLAMPHYRFLSRIEKAAKTVVVYDVAIPARGKEPVVMPRACYHDNRYQLGRRAEAIRSKYVWNSFAGRKVWYSSSLNHPVTLRVWFYQDPTGTERSCRSLKAKLEAIEPSPFT